MSCATQPSHPGLYGRGRCGYGISMPGASSSVLLIADPGVPAGVAERLSDSLPNALMMDDDAVEAAAYGPRQRQRFDRAN
jgi:hypothetical protein